MPKPLRTNSRGGSGEVDLQLFFSFSGSFFIENIPSSPKSSFNWKKYQSAASGSTEESVVDSGESSSPSSYHFHHFDIVPALFYHFHHFDIVPALFYHFHLCYLLTHVIINSYICHVIFNCVICLVSFVLQFSYWRLNSWWKMMIKLSASIKKVIIPFLQEIQTQPHQHPLPKIQPQGGTTFSSSHKCPLKLSNLKPCWYQWIWEQGELGDNSGPNSSSSSSTKGDFKGWRFEV